MNDYLSEKMALRAIHEIEALAGKTIRGKVRTHLLKHLTRLFSRLYVDGSGQLSHLSAETEIKHQEMQRSAKPVKRKYWKKRITLEHKTESANNPGRASL